LPSEGASGCSASGDAEPIADEIVAAVELGLEPVQCREDLLA
jgi:hypothetical protein